MARFAAEHGTKLVLATPHRKDVTQNWSVQHIRGLVDEMNVRIREQAIDLTILLGMENHLDLELPGEVLNGNALPINDSRYILVEMPFFGRPNYVEDVLFQLQLQGRTPILAHPERIEAFQLDPELLVTFVERGMLSQVTAGSVSGHFGRKVQRFTTTLLRRGLVHILASDCHFPKGPRSPELFAGMVAAAGIVGEARARLMVVDTPKMVLEDRHIEVESPGSADYSTRWWQFWKKRKLE